MRPLKLVMTGFESYKDRTEINFEDFGTKGLYLVSGDTGAGKTTIFDAITYALYGEASGENREAKNMLRSHFADISTPTLVELDFEANGKKYHIERNPEYERKAEKGTGKAKQEARASLDFLSESRDPITGLNKVTSEVINILSLDKNQFSKIAMIAQGSFQKLLLSKNDEKIKLFRELFQTGKYNQLQEKLKNDASEASKEVENLKLKLNEALSRIEVSETDENEEKIRHMKISQYVKEEEIEVLRGFVLKDEKVLDVIKNEIDETENKLRELELSLKDGEKRLELEENLKEVKAALEEKKADAEKAGQNFLEAGKNAEAIPELQSQKALLEDSLKEYEAISCEEKEIASLRHKIDEDKKGRETKLTEKETFSDQLAKLKAESENYRSAGEKIGIYQGELDKKSREEKDLNDIKIRFLTLNEEKKSLFSKQNEVKNALQEFESFDKKYKEMYRLFTLEQAGILAEGLKEGCACPVCGSKEHPNPACKSDKAPAQAELEKAQKTSDELNKKVNGLTLEAEGLKVSVEKSETEINSLLGKCFESLTLNDEKLDLTLEIRTSELKKEVSEIQENIKKEEDSKKRRDEINSKIPELESCIKNIDSEISQKETDIRVNESKCEDKEKHLSEKKSGLKFESKERAEDNLSLLASKIKLLDENLEMARKAKDLLASEIIDLKSKGDLLVNQLKDIKEIDLERTAGEKNQFSQKKKLLNDQRDSLNKRKGINQASLETIEKLLPEISKATEKYNMINALSEVAKGRNNQKPSLENYVQMSCLDRINYRANLRLRKMTDNKYELRRRIDENGSELGLDLNIKDFYTGRERDVKSLSGGEQFQASLALSLGLADEIQENSGGIKLDTMFIDEGFGTLDPDTLNKAMRALEDISQGNKLIGIISHVAELEERIPKKIYVKKDELGISHVKIVNA